jgi:hypothetical protein
MVHIWAGHRLGVEAPIQRIFVFGAAVVTEREIRHGGVWTVVGNVLDDGEARSAIGAVDEGIEVAPVIRIEQFALAIGTDGGIREMGW